MTDNEILLKKAESSKGWKFINIWGESRVYLDGVFIKSVECTLLASLYNDAIKQVYLHDQE